MDPTIQLCQIRDSFKYPRPDPTDVRKTVPVGFSWNNDNIPTVKEDINIVAFNISNIDTIYSPNPSVIDLTEYNNLQILKDEYGHPNFRQARDATNPFENIGRSIFMDRAAIKLANIDSVFGILGHYGGLIAQQTLHSQPFAFLDLAGAPGSFTQYIQFRIPQQAKGLGISLTTTNYNFQWHTKQLDMTRFDTYAGIDGSGNLNTQGENFLKVSKQTFPSGIELVVADGGIETQGREKYQEILSFPLILSECMVAVNALAPKGIFICKIFDSVMDGTIHLLFLLSVAFERFIIFKPMSSRPANSERYVICINKRKDTYVSSVLLKAWNRLLESHLNNEFVMITSLTQDIPNEFLNYLAEQNKISLNLQLAIGGYIKAYLRGENIIIPEYNLYRALIVWNLPDNLEREIIRGEQKRGAARETQIRRAPERTAPARRGFRTDVGMTTRAKSPPRIASPELSGQTVVTSPRSPRGISQTPTLLPFGPAAYASRAAQQREPSIRML